jgi:hypothetical protein
VDDEHLCACFAGKSLAGGMSGAENVYTQHVPFLMTIIENIFKGKLREQQVGVFLACLFSFHAYKFFAIVVPVDLSVSVCSFHRDYCVYSGRSDI